MSVCASVDHFMWGAADLEQGLAACRERFGVEAAYGGAHKGRGTCNALVSLGESVYLEIIAPDPEQDSAAGLAGQLATLQQPTLITWAAATADLAAVAQGAEGRGLEARGPQVFERATPAGERLRWELLFLAGHEHSSLLPFFIDWQDCPHPATTNPPAGTFEHLRLRSPAAAELEALLNALGLEVAVEQHVAPGIEVAVNTPAGLVVLTSDEHSLRMGF